MVQIQSEKPRNSSSLPVRFARGDTFNEVTSGMNRYELDRHVQLSETDPFALAQRRFLNRIGKGNSPADELQLILGEDADPVRFGAHLDLRIASMLRLLDRFEEAYRFALRGIESDPGNALKLGFILRLASTAGLQNEVNAILDFAQTNLPNQYDQLQRRSIGRITTVTPILDRRAAHYPEVRTEQRLAEGNRLFAMGVIDPRFLADYARVLIKANHPGDAKTVLSMLFARDPIPEAFESMVYFQLENGNRKKAEQYIRQASEAGYRRAYLLQQGLKIALQQNDLEKADDYAAQLIDVTGGQQASAIMYSASRAFTVGDIETARQHLTLFQNQPKAFGKAASTLILSIALIENDLAYFDFGLRGLEVVFERTQTNEPNFHLAVATLRGIFDADENGRQKIAAVLEHCFETETKIQIQKKLLLLMKFSGLFNEVEIACSVNRITCGAADAKAYADPATLLKSHSDNDFVEETVTAQMFRYVDPKISTIYNQTRHSKPINFTTGRGLGYS